MHKPSLQRIVTCPNLPSLPSVALRVLELTRDEETPIEEIAEVVQNDQGLSARILKTVNSSFYGLTTPCPTISRGLAYLGRNTVKSLVLGFSLVDVSKSDSSEQFDLIGLWRRALFTAVASRRLAILNQTCDPDEAFMAALMQDIGMLAMQAAMPAQYSKIAATTQHNHRALPGVEKEAFGFDHTTVGVELGQRWKLPPQIVEVIRQHHDSEPTSHHELVRTVMLGGNFAEAVDCAEAGSSIVAINRDAADWFGIDPTQTTEILQSISSEATELAHLFQIDAGELPDTDAILLLAKEAAMQHLIQVCLEADQLRQDNRKLSRQAHTDGLTELGNRKRFDEQLCILFDKARKYDAELSVILFDLDSFKALNDTLGHQAGDEVLREIGRRMHEMIESPAITCRYGGEEFAVLLPDTSRQQAATFAEHIRRSIEQTPIRLRGVTSARDEATITTSVGVAVLEPSTAHVFSKPALLVAAADKAMYAAKSAGRNCVRIFTVRSSTQAGEQDAALDQKTCA